MAAALTRASTRPNAPSAHGNDVLDRFRQLEVDDEDAGLAAQLGDLGECRGRAPRRDCRRAPAARPGFREQLRDCAAQAAAGAGDHRHPFCRLAIVRHPASSRYQPRRWARRRRSALRYAAVQQLDGVLPDRDGRAVGSGPERHIDEVPCRAVHRVAVASGSTGSSSTPASARTAGAPSITSNCRWPAGAVDEVLERVGVVGRDNGARCCRPTRARRREPDRQRRRRRRPRPPRAP